MLLALFIVCMSSTSSDTAKLSYWIRNPEFDDVIIEDDIISTINVLTKVTCGIECATSDGCQSFSYNGHNGDNGTCLMYTATFTSSSGCLPSPGSRYYTLDVSANYITEDGYVCLAHPKICFKVYTDKRTRAEARDYCNETGSRLVVLDTKEKNRAVSTYIRKNIGGLRFYIGLTDIDREGNFVWDNGIPVKYTRWLANQPNNRGNQDCVILRTSSAAWNDMKCQNNFKYICEKPL